MRIPKIIHFIWIGHSEIPEKVQLCYESWNCHHPPQWEIKHWRDEHLTFENFPLTLGQLWRCRNTAQAKDILMFEILFKFGGFYVDSDMMCIHRLENFIDPASRLIVTDERGSVWHKLEKSEGPAVPCSNSFVGCVQGHEMMLHAITQLNTRHFVNWNRIEINEETGPFFFGKMLQPFLKDPHTQVLIPRVLYSWLWNTSSDYIISCLEQVRFQDKDWSIEKNRDLIEFYHDFEQRKVLGAHLWLKMWNRFSLKIENEKRFHSVTCIVPFRFATQERLDNLKLTIKNIHNITKQLSVPSKIIISEQDQVSKLDLEKNFSKYNNVEHVFYPYTEPGFNRSLALNIGVERAKQKDPFSGAIIFWDGDLLVDEQMTVENIENFLSSKSCMHAASLYEKAYDLDQHDTELYKTLMQDILPTQNVHRNIVQKFGQERMGSQAVTMAFIMSKIAYGQAGGWDENFNGWGKEDEDFSKKVYGALHRLEHEMGQKGALRIHQYKNFALHLYHPTQVIKNTFGEKKEDEKK